MRRVGIVLGVLVLLFVALLVAGYVALQQIDWNQYKQPVAEAVADATGRRLDLGGDVDLQIGLRPGIRIQQVAFANASWGSRPEMATLDELVVRLRLLPLLSGNVEVERVDLVGLDVLLETRADGAVNWDFEPAPAAPERAPAAGEKPRSAPPSADSGEPPRPAVPEEPGVGGGQALGLLLQHAEIRDAVVVLRDQAAGREQRIALERFFASMPAVESPLHVEMEASYGDAPFELSGDIEGLARVTAGEPIGLELKAVAAGATLDVKGSLREPRTGSGLDLKLHLVAPELAKLSALAGTELPALAPLEVAFSLSGGGDAYAIRDLAVSLGRTRLNGALDAALGGVRPRIDARLTAPRIDLADFQAPAEPQALRVRAAPGIQLVSQEQSAPPAKPEPLFSREPLALEGLGALDAKLSLKAASLQADTIELADLDLGLDLKASRLAIHRLRAGLAGGRIDVQLGLDASTRPPRLSLSGTARGVRTGDLAAAQGSQVLADGPLDLDFDLNGRGGSLHAILATLEGSLQLSMGPALVRNEDLALALSDAESLVAGRVSKEAPLQCVFGEFGIREGVARPSSLVVHLGSIALFGDGKIDLGEERMKLEFDRVAQKLSASTVLPPFTLKGPLTDPEAGIASGALVGKAIDLGGALLGTKSQSRGPVASDCRELSVAYADYKARRKETARELEGRSGEIFDKVKGLFK